MAGDPDQKHTPKIAAALIKGGVDILELGLPFSDPIADGPTIQQAGVRALAAGTKPRTVFDLAAQIDQNCGVPLVLMTYFNPVFRMGVDSFLGAAKSCRVSGVIVPDLPIEEAGEYRRVAAEYGLNTIFLVAPSTTNARLRRIVGCSSGFVYLVAHFGVTGARSAVKDSTIELVNRVLPFTRGRIPLAVGFGVSKPEHAQRIFRAGADGVIVGSTFVNIISKNLSEYDKMLEETEVTARLIKQALL
jgi:tryptophan synthase alpha chain